MKDEFYNTYLGHKLVGRGPDTGASCIIYECVVCKIRTYYYILPQIHAVNDLINSALTSYAGSQYYKLILTCDEIQIKNLLE